MMIPAVIKVFLSDDPNSAVDAPITPNTTALDVIQYCREPGETACHLAELWRGNEREVSEGEKPYTILQQWGSYAPEVQFYLRHVSGSAGNIIERQNSWADDQNVIQSLANRTDLSLTELKEMAQRQQKQIEQQQQMLVGKEQRLRFLRQQAQQQQAMLGENDRLKRLREKAEAQEAKLKKIRAMRGKLDQRRYDNTTLSAELEAVRALFEEKQSELSKAVSKVDDLTRQLDDLKNSKLGSGGQDSGQQVTNTAVDGNYSSTSELEKLRKELSILNHMNEEQQKQLNEKRSVLKKRNEDAGDLDRRIEDLTDRLKKKRAAAGLPDDQWSGGDKNKAQSYKVPPGKMHTIVAAVEPVKQSPQNVQEDYDMMHMKHRQGSYQGYGQEQVNNNNSQGMLQQAGQPYRGQIDNSNRQTPPYMPRQNTYGAPSGNKLPQKQQLTKSNSSDNLQGQGDGFAANRAMFEKAQPGNKPPPISAGNRAQSAMAQLFPTPPPKAESLTAKVRPMFAKGAQQQQGYGSPTATNAASSPGINLFAYTQPPAVTTPSFLPSNVTVLPSGNIRYTQPPAGHPPPPYPSGSRAVYGDSNSPERHVPIDIEALRRKFAHAPRPLKKRSSITEPERPQGPAIPKFIYEQIYKQADTPFYRPSGDDTPAVPVPPIPDTPPPAYVAPAKPPLPPIPAPEQQLPDAISYEHNVSPAAYRKQQQNLRKIAAAVNQMKSGQEISQIPTPEVQEDQSRVRDDYDDHSPQHSNDFETSSDISSSTLPSIVVPQLPYAPVPTKSNLKTRASIPKGLRIRFDPLALLLDASLEGEFDLVQDIIDQVPDPSGANDEGITALHNAVCAGHTDLVRFLVHYGSDINAADTDGWTPLHCAASCNNLSMAKFLVENGACIFATTISDGETAADKCEELDEGYLPCFDYLSGIQEKFGIVNKGQVFALYDYEGEAEDELSYKDGDIMTIIRRGDDSELEWWWARKQDKEGYIARNLLGMWPRIKPRDDRD
uniref:apoptosis-stimulating of p53 protein 1-like n=1 Tax=Styela clava TaxID=7725 RepID=UPI00193AAF86|nr:apoptosis-stimulating of p53 protein 1-like [Styela clava]